MLKHRLLMSAILIPSAVGLFAWDHRLGAWAPVLAVLMLVISTRCVWELVTLFRLLGCRPNLGLALFATWALIALSWQPIWIEVQASKFGWNFSPGWLFVLLGAIVVVLLANAVRRYPLGLDEKESAATAPLAGRDLLTLTSELLIVCYVGVLLALTVQLRWHGASAQGYFALGALVIATKMGDVGAYTFGRWIGGPKMTPRLSPGKTISGGCGHLATAGLCSVLWLCWIGPRISWNWPAWSAVDAFSFGVVVGGAGLVGDLAESLIKRETGVKDAPILLPGFGGLLDLMDSLLLAGPVAYGMWQWLGPWR